MNEESKWQTGAQIFCQVPWETSRGFYMKVAYLIDQLHAGSLSSFSLVITIINALHPTWDSCIFSHMDLKEIEISPGRVGDSF